MTPSYHRCPRCKMHLPRSSFNVKRNASCGLNVYCRACSAEIQRDIREQEPEKTRKYTRRYYKKNKVKAIAGVKSWIKANPKAATAMRKVRRALGKYGRLVMPDSCDLCGRSDRKLQLHHDDYAFPLRVVTLCVSCHKRTHSAKRNISLELVIIPLTLCR